MSSSTLFKRWSLKYTRQIILALLFIVVVMTMALFLLSAGLRCVGDDGCFREHCEFGRFAPEYRNLIKKSNNGNPNCRI